MALRQRNNRAKAISTALRQIDKSLKTEHAVQRLGDTTALQIERFSSGILALDIAMGGGCPVGRLIELFG